MDFWKMYPNNERIKLYVLSHFVSGSFSSQVIQACPRPVLDLFKHDVDNFL